MTTTPEIQFRCTEPSGHGFRKVAILSGPVVNPGGWFGGCRTKTPGTLWLMQIAMSNAGGLSFIIEADDEGSAIDYFVDSRFSHLIVVDEDEADEDCTCAGNNGHPVNLDDVYLTAVSTADVRYFVEWSPENDAASANIEAELETMREDADDGTS